MFKNTKIRKLFYHLKYQYPTREVVVMFGIGLLALWFMWGSVQAMQKNYQLRQVVEDKKRQAQLIELEAEMLEYRQNYLKSDEYRKLAVREYLGYGDPGEKLLILPANSQKAIATDEQYEDNATPTKITRPSNLSQWLNFLLGSNAKA